MLGHAKLSSTQIYTQVSIRMLKHVHTATHPAQLQKPESLAKEDAASSELSKEELFAVLALEAEEENQEKG
jgi:integrase/recombinase XerD